MLTFLLFPLASPSRPPQAASSSANRGRPSSAIRAAAASIAAGGTTTSPVAVRAKAIIQSLQATVAVPQGALSPTPSPAAAPRFKDTVYAHAHAHAHAADSEDDGVDDDDEGDIEDDLYAGLNSHSESNAAAARIQRWQGPVNNAIHALARSLTIGSPRLASHTSSYDVASVYPSPTTRGPSSSFSSSSSSSSESHVITRHRVPPRWFRRCAAERGAAKAGIRDMLLAKRAALKAMEDKVARQDNMGKRVARARAEDRAENTKRRQQTETTEVGLGQ